jgi:acyl dehydratase
MMAAASCPRKVGDETPSRTFGPLTLTDFVRYQGASGDMNPMHHDDQQARAAGYREAFGVGMLGAGYLAAVCTDAFGPDSVRRFSTRFRQLIWRGDVLTATGRVVEVVDVDDEPSVVVEFALVNQDGVIVTEGSGRFVLTD